MTCRSCRFSRQCLAFSSGNAKDLPVEELWHADNSHQLYGELYAIICHYVIIQIWDADWSWCVYTCLYVWSLLIQFSQFSPRCTSLWMPPSPSVLELLCLIPCTCTVTRCGHVPLGMGIIWHHGLGPARACRTVPGGGLGHGQVGRAVWWEQVEYQEPNLQGHYGHLIWRHLNTSESGCTERQVPVVSTVLTCLDHFLQQLVRRCSKWVVVKDQPALHSSCWMLNKRSKGMPGCPAARCRMWFLCTVTHGSWFNLLRQILGFGCALDGLRFGMCEESRLMRACGRCVLKLVKKRWKLLRYSKTFQDNRTWRLYSLAGHGWDRFPGIDVHATGPRLTTDRFHCHVNIHVNSGLLARCLGGCRGPASFEVSRDLSWQSFEPVSIPDDCTGSSKRMQKVCAACGSRMLSWVLAAQCVVPHKAVAEVSKIGNL